MNKYVSTETKTNPYTKSAVPFDIAWGIPWFIR